MKSNEDRVYLLHIRDSIAKIAQYLKGIQEDQFRKTELVQDGVIRQLEIIGEAVKQLSQGI